LASSRLKTRLKVSCEAMPLANGSQRLSQSSFIEPHSTTVTQLSAPLVMAHSATGSNSSSGCAQVRDRGSSNPLNACRKPGFASPCSCSIAPLADCLEAPI